MPTTPHATPLALVRDPHRELDLEAADLDTLASAVATELAGIERAQRRSMHHAWHAGRLLTAAKARLAHGTWLPWLERAGLSPRTAQRLIAVHRACRSAEEAAEHGTVARALAAGRAARGTQLQIDLDPPPAPSSRWRSRFAHAIGRALARVARWMRFRLPGLRPRRD